MKHLFLVAAILLTHCARRSPTSPIQEDRPIAFPKFYERFPSKTNEGGQFYHLDGATLVALSIAANDFAPKDRNDVPCWDRQEAFHYQFVRQGDIIFVRIDSNPSHCEHKFLIMDGGVQYAISLDGRILRRIFDGEPEGPLPLHSTDAGGQRSGLQSIPHFSPGEPDPSFLERLRKKKAAEAAHMDAGLPPFQPPDGGFPVPTDGGYPPLPDGGVPSATDGGP